MHALLAAARGTPTASAAVQLRADGAPDEATCDATVSYLFLAPQAELPLAKVWREYFDGCPGGSFTVHVHAQQGSAVPELPEAAIVSNPLMGDLRFSYKMQAAMNRLYQAATSKTAANGCEPRWAQMLSDSCTPVTTCSAAHEGLAKLRGTSQFEARSIRQMKPKQKPARWFPVLGKPTDGYEWWRQSQWSTLWMDHARLLLEHEEENRPAWEAVTRWPVDSHYAINILYSLRAPFSAVRGTTSVAWNLEHRPLTALEEQEKQLGHPIQFDCVSDVDARHMLTQSLACGRFFARKFTSACVPLLVEWQQNASRVRAAPQSQAFYAEINFSEQLTRGQACNQASIMPL